MLLDMTFDDDTKLFGLFLRYSEPEEQEELKRQVVEYVRTQIHDVNSEIQQFQTENAQAQNVGAPEENQFDVSIRFISENSSLPLFFLDGITWGLDARNAQKTEDGKNDAE